MMRAPGVWPVVDQNVTKYAAVHTTNTTPPITASAVSTFEGTSKRPNANATIATTTIAARSMISASMAKAIARVTRPV